MTVLEGLSLLLLLLLESLDFMNENSSIEVRRRVKEYLGAHAFQGASYCTIICTIVRVEREGDVRQSVAELDTLYARVIEACGSVKDIRRRDGRSSHFCDIYHASHRP